MAFIMSCVAVLVLAFLVTVCVSVLRMEKTIMETITLTELMVTKLYKG
jgi:hypothetical protein